MWVSFEKIAGWPLRRNFPRRIIVLLLPAPAQRGSEATGTVPSRFVGEKFNTLGGVRMKKVLTIALALSALGMVLAGCSGGAEAPKTGESAGGTAGTGGAEGTTTPETK